MTLLVTDFFQVVSLCIENISALHLPASGDSVHTSYRLLCNIPSSNLEIPSSKLEIPSSDLEIPSSNLNIPSSNLKIPSSDLEVPSSDLEVPSSNLEIPSSNLEIPSSNLEIPSSNLEIPIPFHFKNDTNTLVGTRHCRVPTRNFYVSRFS